MLEKASELSEAQKYSQALKYYESILRVDPVNITAIIDYGVTLQNLAEDNAEFLILFYNLFCSTKTDLC